MERTQQHFKAIISNHGDVTLYDKLSGEIERRLPIVPVSWQRSFGRPAKEVELQASFTKFDPTRLSTSGNAVQSASSILSSRPLLHIYWTSCLDNDKYKSSVRNQILQWHKLLTEKQCENWLIIHVLYQDNSKLNKSKINLPRSSVYDKIKSEFNQKFQEKCLQLWEPDKETLFTKSSESWDALLNQLRNLLVESFGQHLDSFEERVRLTREKYAHPDWPFLDYFLVHEELALTYQSITLRDDALIQYDEVDALLSQFIINSAGRELPRWLQKFCAMPANWDGVSVSNQNMDSYKELIKSGNASLIDFRNYVFARQCKLLMLMNRRGAVPSRMMEFIYMVIQEMKLLKIQMQLGATECWTFLTCMQLFQVIENVENKDYEFKSTYAHLYNYMRQKFQYLGQITGLYYNRAQTQEEKNLSGLLTAGFGKYPSRKQEMPSSIKLLKVALASKNSYETLFLDISNKTIHIMNGLKRSHFGMYAGIDLAKFHLQYGRYDEAEMLLEKAWSIYKTQRWEALYTDVLIPLADCQLKHDMHKRYINSITLLSCAECLSFETRNFYSNELLKLSTDESLKLPVIGMEPVINIKEFRINLVRNKGHIGDCVKVTFTLINELTIDLPCKSICLVLKHSDLDNPKSFSDSHMHTPTHSSSTTPTVSPHPPIKLIDPANTAISVSLLSDERPKDGSAVKDSMTPTTFLQKIKGHRRTWSKTLTETKSLTDSVNSSPTGARSASISSINTYPETRSTNAKKALFADDVVDADKPLSPLDKSFSLPNLSVASANYDGEKVGCFDDILQVEAVGRSSEGSGGGDLGTEDQMCPVSERSSVTSSAQLQGPDIPMESPVSACDVAPHHDDTVNVSNSTVFIEPEEEEEVNLDQKLTSKQDFLLTPGSNRVELKSDISIEGKFVLHCVNCLIGNVTFYKLLTQLPKDSKSFYMVADPPKIVWTTAYKDEHLLTTAKQRLHVTLLNQPGIIREGSLLQISSQTGLHFIDSSSSPIQIYPLERDGDPRDAEISMISQNSDAGDDSCSTLVSLPECKPYERVNVYFDVTAPPCELWRGGGGTEEAVQCTHHTLHFNCLWLKGLVGFPSATLACSFYEPFTMTYETVQKGDMVFIKVVLRGVNPISLLLTRPKLTSVVQDGVSFTLLSCDRVSLYGCEECCILWKLNITELDLEYDKENLECVFDIDFQREDSIHESDIAHFSRDLAISFAKCLYSVEVSFKAGSPLITSQSCSVTVTVVKLFKDDPDYRLFLLLNTEKKIWNYTDSQDRYHEITFDSNSPSSRAESLLGINITSNRAGSVAAPVFFLAKLNISGEVDMDVIGTDMLVENVKSFHYGEVNYKHSAHNVVLSRKDDDPVAKVDM